ncbi:MAG: hypothetical protein EBS55_09730 [Flavobacteriaceae bacterium]|nr:hypothetical protein [Flavobacteriaceae bacterium]
MSKKLINEDIKNMKYLFGYKPGRVISEQDIDYTTDAYLDVEMDEERRPERLVKHIDTGKIVGTHKYGRGFTPNRHGEELGFEYHPSSIPNKTKFGGTEVGDFDYEDEDFDFKMPPYDDEDTLFEQEEPETDRYMFFSNLQQIHRQTGILLEKDPEMISQILENGHDWAQDHIATAKESIDQVFDFLMNEENDESNDLNMIMNEDLEFEEKETTESILEKHNLLDKTNLAKDNMVMFTNQSSEVIQKFLEILPELSEIQMFSIVNCESADFSDVDICDLPELAFINLLGTENNLEEQGYECVKQEEETPYFFYLE